MIFEKANSSRELNKINPVIVVTAFFWLIAKLMTYRLWTSDRLFPLVPPFEFLNDLPGSYHLIFYGVSMCCLVILLFRPAVIIILILFLSEIFSCIADQNRWQPWEYQYLFIMLMFLLNRKHFNYFISAIVIIIISIYFYSGISKLNNGFLQSQWSDMLLKRFFGISNVTTDSPILYYMGYGVGALEIICAIGLIFQRSKKTAACILIGVHSFNLLLLGPLGTNYNKIVWPWNIAMIGYLYFLFLHSHREPGFFYSLKKGWNKLVIICWVILPVLYYFNSWDTYLSSVLYSGNVKEMFICVKDSGETGVKNLAPYYVNDYSNFCDGDKMILVTKWALGELNVPVYPEKRVYLQIKKSFNKKYSSATGFFILYKHNKGELK